MGREADRGFLRVDVMAPLGKIPLRSTELGFPQSIGQAIVFTAQFFIELISDQSQPPFGIVLCTVIMIGQM